MSTPIRSVFTERFIFAIIHKIKKLPNCILTFGNKCAIIQEVKGQRKIERIQNLKK